MSLVYDPKESTKKTCWELNVVGSRYYADEPAMLQKYTFTLVPEPGNPHDPNAIAVCQETKDRTLYKIGYLSRQFAEKWGCLSHTTVSGHTKEWKGGDLIILTISKDKLFPRAVLETMDPGATRRKQACQWAISKGANLYPPDSEQVRIIPTDEQVRKAQEDVTFDRNALFELETEHPKQDNVEQDNMKQPQGTTVSPEAGYQQLHLSDVSAEQTPDISHRKKALTASLQLPVEIASRLKLQTEENTFHTTVRVIPAGEGFQVQGKGASGNTISLGRLSDATLEELPLTRGEAFPATLDPDTGVLTVSFPYWELKTGRIFSFEEPTLKQQQELCSLLQEQGDVSFLAWYRLNTETEPNLTFDGEVLSELETAQETLAESEQVDR